MGQRLMTEDFNFNKSVLNYGKGVNENWDGRGWDPQSHWIDSLEGPFFSTIKRKESD
jgi:hypothetical protein